MLYPGPGQGIEVGGSYGPVSPVAWNDSATGHAWAGSMPFSTGGNALMFNIPKLAGADVWTQGYLTFFLSSNTTATHYNVAAYWQYYTGANTTDTHFGGSNVDPVSTISLAAGAPLDPVSVGTFFPQLVFPPSQGIAKPFFVDLGKFNDPTDFLQAAIPSANNYNANGLTGANHAGFSGFHSDINLLVSITGANGGSTGGATMTIYNPVLTMFSLLQYAWIPPSAGGVSIAPELLALGMFGRRRNA